MRYSKLLLIGSLILILAAIPFTGCASNSEYEELQAAYEKLEYEYTTLVSENTSLKTELEKVQSDLTNVQGDYETLQSSYEALEADYASLDASQKDMLKELAQIEEVYPPKYFSSAKELQNWLANDDISDRASVEAVLVYKSALELQKRALQDGYIVNANITTYGAAPGYYNIYCSAVTEEDSLYYWPPETDDTNYWIVDINDFYWGVGAK